MAGVRATDRSQLRRPRLSHASQRGRHHHGDLRSALVDAAIGVIAERSLRGFSLAEASRRLGVTTTAPYRLFADRDDLLAAVAARALSVFAAMLRHAVGTVKAPTPSTLPPPRRSPQRAPS